MSIATEIARISQNVSDSLTEVAAKGVVVPVGSTSDDLPSLIRQITSGSGSAITITDEQDSHGGTIRHITAVDLTGDTVSAATLLQGYTAHNSLGQAITGTYVPGSGSMTIVETEDPGGGTIVTITGTEVTLQSKTATPSTSSQVITPSSGYTGLSQVTVNPIPSQYIIPTGTKNITSNGNNIDVTAYASVNVQVPSSGGTMQSKTGIVPTESSQTITPDAGYDGLSSVQIDGISSTYIGSQIHQRTSTDVTVSGATVSIPDGYYENSVDKSVATGTAGTPTATKGTVTSHSITVTPSVTNVSGYINGGTKTGTAVTVSASELVSGTYNVSSSGTADVTNYASISVSSQTLPTTVSSTSSGTKKATITQNVDGVSYLNIPAGFNATSQYYELPVLPVGTKTITANGTYNAYSLDDLIGYSEVVVNVSGGGGGTYQAKTGIVPTESSQTITPDTGYDALSSVQIDGISSTYVGSGITRRSSSDLTTSGAVVTVPAGYYASQETKSVSTMTLPTSASSSATSGYTSKATISRSTSNQYINIPPGYNSAGGYYTVSAVANGSATNSGSVSGSSATVSTGTNTITLTKSVSITPTVSAGYVSSGTAGNVSVALTASVTTKSAATITPGTTNQTISSGTYLTGTQTISGDANLVGSNIISGKSIFGVSGTVVIQHYYTGSSSPSSSLGVNGDIYLQTS